jgi:hypothetical protein
MSEIENIIENVDPRRRLRDLLAIPERDRSDAQWDEIIELEIRMAPGNTTAAAPHKAESGRRAEQKPAQGRRQEAKPQQSLRQDPPNLAAAKPVKRFPKRPRRLPGTTPEG